MPEDFSAHKEHWLQIGLRRYTIDLSRGRWRIRFRTRYIGTMIAAAKLTRIWTTRYAFAEKMNAGRPVKLCESQRAHVNDTAAAVGTHHGTGHKR
jgi:hypothetical protein